MRKGTSSSALAILVLLLFMGVALAAPTHTVNPGETYTTAHGNIVTAGATPVDVYEGTYGDQFEGDGATITLRGSTTNDVDGNNNTVHLRNNSEVGVEGDSNHIHHDNTAAGTTTTADVEGQGNSSQGGVTTQTGPNSFRSVRTN